MALAMIRFGIPLSNTLISVNMVKWKGILLQDTNQFFVSIYIVFKSKSNSCWPLANHVIKRLREQGSFGFA